MDEFSMNFNRKKKAPKGPGVVQRIDAFMKKPMQDMTIGDWFTSQFWFFVMTSSVMVASQLALYTIQKAMTEKTE